MPCGLRGLRQARTGHCIVVTERSGRKHRHDRRPAESRAPSPLSGGTRLPTESERGLTFLARLAAEFTTVLSLTDLLDHVIHVLHEEAGFDSCEISLLTKHTTEDVESGIPLLIPDLKSEPRWFLREPRIRSAILAPLVVHRRPIGVVGAYREAVGGFPAADLNLLAIVARYLAGAVEVARLHEQLKELAATDSLTGLANRRAFLDRLQAEIQRGRRAKSEFCVALLDLDRFKAVNDIHGHAVGDQVLIRVAETLSQAVRQSDLAARFGGDEFILLLPESSRAQAMEMLDRLRTVVIPLPDRAGRGVRTTFSWGIAAWPRDGEEPDQLLQVADLRLYAMKRDTQSQDPPAASTGK
ncbi:MAG: sensor domain-containing diguanylate cyclase [Bacillati bacterium ANGP1]|uniref:Sensor domain-containing diguanylate cyclase n=1 Tax=Candidatus Segetimicrobium genomatis TaxID=2569760 RepID=A0A537LLE5_9BACT|nr:MAG: sensor domain-containing diguanylate cyclase [Terrabacteria group bacterium ANGP1]